MVRLCTNGETVCEQHDNKNKWSEHFRKVFNCRKEDTADKSAEAGNDWGQNLGVEMLDSLISDTADKSAEAGNDWGQNLGVEMLESLISEAKVIEPIRKLKTEKSKCTGGIIA